MKFETACFHPNVDQYGNICLDILKDKWSAAYSVRTVLLSIQSLLGEPNNDSPLNAYAAKVSTPVLQWAECLSKVQLNSIGSSTLSQTHQITLPWTFNAKERFHVGKLQAHLLCVPYRGEPSDRLADL